MNTLGLTEWLFDMKATVLPSGVALTSAEVPVMPPAPGRFSITTAWPPSALDKAFCAVRTMVSTPEPAPTGRITRSGAVDCAQAGTEAEARRHEAASATRLRRLKDWVMDVSWL